MDIRPMDQAPIPQKVGESQIQKQHMIAETAEETAKISDIVQGTLKSSQNEKKAHKIRLQEETPATQKEESLFESVLRK